MQRKTQPDQVVYSLIRTQDADLANELYFRLLEGEQTFSDLAAQHSQGSEAAKGGLVGPVEIGAYHPSLAYVLATRAPGELVAPLSLEDCVVIIRIEQKIPARFDEATQQRLLDELFAAWLDAELRAS
ncbi:peptidylprolyl isomerase [Leptolyngbya sp. O-77]|uniref:peptidylprolyl isomerase n=1 Tax=Leptolyngbya sp. O-77 TaxID=1080068 RepID=UPI00155F7BAF|nr:peptidylprolyl isomerase [Leptolyngbya sp. O-77]